MDSRCTRTLSCASISTNPTTDSRRALRCANSSTSRSPARTRSFYDDVVIVDDNQQLVGLVSTLRLVRAQSQLMADQYLLLDHQRTELERVNDDLRDSLELQRKLEHQVVQEAKSALLQSLAGGIAHEINNKLVPIMGYAELMAEQAVAWGDGALEEYCKTVRTCALESAQIIRQLLELSKPSAPALAVVDLRALIEQAMTFTQLRIKESDTTFSLDLPDYESGNSSPTPRRSNRWLSISC